MIPAMGFFTDLIPIQHAMILSSVMLSIPTCVLQISKFRLTKSTFTLPDQSFIVQLSAVSLAVDFVVLLSISTTKLHAGFFIELGYSLLSFIPQFVRVSGSSIWVPMTFLFICVVVINACRFVKEWSWIPGYIAAMCSLCFSLAIVFVLNTSQDTAGHGVGAVLGIEWLLTLTVFLPMFCLNLAGSRIAVIIALDKCIKLICITVSYTHSSYDNLISLIVLVSGFGYCNMLEYHDNDDKVGIYRMIPCQYLLLAWAFFLELIASDDLSAGIELVVVMILGWMILVMAASGQLQRVAAVQNIFSQEVMSPIAQNVLISVVASDLERQQDVGSNIPKKPPAKVEEFWNACDDEAQSEYCIGGYHPVHSGDCYGGYTILCKLGWGKFSTVWLSQDAKGEFSAMKISKSAPELHRAAQNEICILEGITEVKQRLAPGNENFPLTAHKNHFDIVGPHGTHLCMVLDLLGPNILKLISTHDFKGISSPIVKTIVSGILEGLKVLDEELCLMHTDLKPENILLEVCDESVLLAIQKSTGVDQSLQIKTNNDILHGQYSKLQGEDLATCLRRCYRVRIADYGSARWVSKTYPTSEVQTREYRCPEVLLGSNHFTPKIDIWSLACIVFELLTGDFLFDPKRQTEIDFDTCMYSFIYVF